MSEAILNDRLVLTDGNVDPDAGILHATSPFIIGLIGAVLGMALIAPEMLRHGQVIVASLLIPALIVSVGLYAWSVINPGDVSGVIADPTTRTLEIIQSNAFASRRTGIAFADIARIGVATAYDKDGYSARAAVLTLRNGEKMQLGISLDDNQFSALQRLIGVQG